MLGIIGFTAAALVFGLYAYSLNTPPKTKLRLQSFQLAYVLLALACCIWAIGVAVGTLDMLRTTIIVGNLLIFAATVALVDTVTSYRYRRPIAAAIGVAGLLFVLVRFMYLMPNPFIANGILVFNSQAAVTVILGAVFIGIWLPVNLYVSKRLTADQHIVPLQSISAIAFVVATLGVIVFLAARRPLTLALAFSILCCAFASLAGMNYLQRKVLK